MNEISLNQEIMTSNQLFEMMHFESKSSLHRAIRDMFQSKIDTGVILASVITKGLNKGQIDYYGLQEKESKMFAAKHDINCLEKVIEFWISKHQSKQLPQNFTEALRLAADQQDSIIKLKIREKIKDDYVIAINKARIESGDIKVSEFCKSSNILDIGQNKMYDWLRDQGYLFKGSREPIQRFVGMGIFRWLPTEEKHGGKYRYTLYITARGKIYLAEKYLNYLDESCKK